MSVDDVFKEALDTYRSRSGKYGNTWDQVGEITKILYPNGVPLRSSKDFARMHILQWLIGKLVRYVNSGEGGVDMGVYAFILEHIDRDCD